MQLQSTVAAPVERVFEAYTDLRGAPGRIEAITSLEVLGDGTVGPGTRFCETRIMFGKERTEELAIGAFEPPHGYTVVGESCGVRFETAFRFAAGAGGGTTVTMDLTSRPTRWTARLLLPLGWLMAGTMRKAMQKDLDDLRAHLERREA
jgi:uncharacterized membrane protein